VVPDDRHQHDIDPNRKGYVAALAASEGCVMAKKKVPDAYVPDKPRTIIRKGKPVKVWPCVEYVEDSAKPKGYRRSVKYFGLRKVALEEAKQLNELALKRFYYPTADKTFQDAMDAWLKEKREILKPNTMVQYDYVARFLGPAIGSLDLETLTTKQIEDALIPAMRHIKPTLERAIKVTGEILNWARSQQPPWLVFNPLQVVKAKRIRALCANIVSTQERFTLEELSIIERAVLGPKPAGSKRHVRTWEYLRLIFALGFYGGLGAAEMAGLHWEDVGAKIKVRFNRTTFGRDSLKTQWRPRENECWPPIAAALDQVAHRWNYPKSGPIFRTIYGKPIHGKDLGRDFSRLVVALGITKPSKPGAKRSAAPKAGIHGLRASCSVALYRATNGDLNRVANYMGWKNGRMFIEHYGNHSLSLLGEEERAFRGMQQLIAAPKMLPAPSPVQQWCDKPNKNGRK
jgi:integrase